MAFEDIENSEYDNEPRELYWFMRGSESWLYTSGSESVVFDDRTFEPVPGLSRTSAREGAERTKSQITVEMPRDTPIAEQFIGIPSVTPVWLYVYRIHSGETGYRIVWQGRVRVAEFAGARATLTLDSLRASTKKAALRHLFQNQCNHFTFDANCGLSEADYTNYVEVTAVDGASVQALDGEAAGFYTAGQVKRTNGDRRFVVSNSVAAGTHTLNLLTPFEDLEVGELVAFIGGACKHTFETCPIQANYGGYPKVPRKDPFKSFH
jgi:uncharacterized phage protein (TIGR02218 family)